MNQKITAVNIADALATKLTFPKKVADLFMHAFCDTIIEGLDTDGIVKVRGLGTFRIVNVDSRESVSVSTGERIVIPSFRKLTFTPEDSVTDRISGIEPEPSVPSEEPATIPTEEPVVLTEEPVVSTEEPVVSSEEPVVVPPVEEFFSVIQEASPSATPVEETPTDEFSGIDVLIATPESLEELHDRLAEARQQQNEANEAVLFAQNHLDEVKAQALRAEESVAVARQRAEEQQAEVERIQQLIEHVETNRPTLLASQKPSITPPDEEEPLPESPAEETQEEVTTPSQSEPISPSKEDDEESDEEKTPWWRIPLILLILLIVGAACYFVAFNPKRPLQWLNLDKQEAPAQPMSEQPTVPTPAVRPEPNDTIVVEPLTTPATENTDAASATKTEPAKKQPTAEPKPEKPAEPARPKTHKIRRGDTLTKISMQYYGTKDSVRAIIRANNFKDPNNINEGAVVKLP